MQQLIQEELVKLQPKGLLTIPKKFRTQIGLKENSILKIKQDKNRLILEPVYVLEYPVRRYTKEEIGEFLALDERETKLLKKKKMLK